MGEYKIENSYFWQDIFKYWQESVKRFGVQFSPMVNDDCQYLSKHYEEKFDEHCPKDITIFVNGLARIATLLGIKMYLQLLDDGNISFDFQPILWCKGIDFNDYAYSGIID